MSRRLDNFIDGFVEYASVFNAPKRYLRWAGLFMASSLVTRQVGLAVRGNILSPNLYVQMIGGPSVGKSQTCKAMRSILQPATDFSFVPKSLTRAALEDYMAETKKARVTPEGGVTFSNEFIGIADELQGILPDQDLGHLTMYNELYDLPHVYTAMTRGNGEVRLEDPYCALFTGAQPQFLSITMPEGAWGMGFMSRTIMVFDVARDRTSAFSATTVNNKLKSDLIHDAREIFKLHGYMKWEPNAVELYEAWWVSKGGMPVPSAKRLVMGYNGRRELHMMKIAMGVSLAHSSDLIVTQAHVAEAISMLLEAEQQMQYIFNEMASSGSMMAIEDAIELVRQNTINGKDTTEAALIEVLMQRFPSTQVAAIIENLVSSKALQPVGNIMAKGMRRFKPGDKLGKL